MSRLKEISASSSVMSAIQSVSNANSVTPTENADAFGGIVDMASPKQGTSEKNESNKDETGAEEMAMNKKAKTREADTDDKINKDDASHEGTKGLNDQEQTEIDTYKIDVAELAHQLNLSFEQLKNNMPAEQQINAAGPLTQIVVESVKPARNISEELLKKIDVETLRQQMELVMAQKEPVDIHSEVPREMLGAPQDQMEILSASEVTAEISNMMVEETQQAAPVDIKGPLKDMFQSDVTDNFLKSQPGQNSALSKSLEAQRAVGAYVGLDQEPDVVMDVVAIDLNRLKAPKDQKGDFVLMSADTLDPEGIIDFKAKGLQNMFEVSKSGQPGSDVPPQFMLTGLADNNNQTVVGMSYLAPLREKIGEIMLQMSQAGKSGITRIQIYPPELGAVNIRFSVHNDKVKIQIITEEKATKSMLESHAGYLKEIVMVEKLEVTSFEVVQDRDFFKTDQQQVISDFARQRHETDRGMYQDHSETKRQEIEKLREMVGEKIKRNRGSTKNLDVTA
ncbi:MAG: flagellar hook-length control protein FliK [Deltaproteobacteria bacterium]|nr:flagellar hook-length control protein FliK [Deltaproteobacteria bacterium]